MSQFDRESHGAGIASFSVAVAVTPSLMHATGKGAWGVVMGVHRVWSDLVASLRRSRVDPRVRFQLVLGLLVALCGVFVTARSVGTSLFAFLTGMGLVALGFWGMARPGRVWGWQQELGSRIDMTFVAVDDGPGRSRRMAVESVAPRKRSVEVGLVSGALLPRG
jgi:hypothetical protein